jgi:lysophospholipase L1-like esterase
MGTHIDKPPKETRPVCFLRQLLARLLLIFIGLLVALMAGEIGLRIIVPPAKQFYVMPPHMRVSFNPDPEDMPGISGESRFHTNSIGLRADELSGDLQYQILAIGGSTTECLYLDQTEAWPFLLQEGLNQQREDKVWVGNAGVSGRTTREHVLQMQYLLPQHPDIDLAIVLVGVNDLALRLAQDVDYTPYTLDDINAQEKLLYRAFTIVPQSYYYYDEADSNLLFIHKTAVWHLARQIQRNYMAGQAQAQAQDSSGKVYDEWRKNRQRATVIRDTLPDLSPALAEYRQNINAIINLAEQHSVRLIFLTQPSMWQADLPPELNNLLWFGAIGGGLGNQDIQAKAYYSTEALQAGMDRYNETLLNICQERQVECLDLAALLPKDTSVFYDDVHFNENGARQVAEHLTQYMLAH